MKTYQKFTLIVVILGNVVPVLGLYTYFFNTTLIPKEEGGYPLPFGGAIFMILIISINIAELVAAFKIKNTKIVGIMLMGWGVVLLLAFQLIGIPGLILFVIAGILALKEPNPSYDLKVRDPSYDSTQDDGAVCLNCQTRNLYNSVFCNNCGQKI